MVFREIIAPEVIFPTQNESAQSDTCNSRYPKNTETYAADAKEAPIISNLLLVWFHPSAPSSTNPSSNHILCKGFFTDQPSEKVIWSIKLFPSLRINHKTSFVKISFILCQFRAPHFLSFAFLIQVESEEMVFIRIVSPEVSFPTQKESAQSDTCNWRYFQNTETCTADAKEASIISNLILVCFHPSAASSTNPL